MSEPTNPYASPLAEAAPLEDGPSEFALADRGARLVAVIIDGVLTSAIALPLFFGLGVVSLDPTAQPATVSDVVIQTVLSYVLGIGAYAAIHGYFIYTRSQSLGKMAMKIKMVRKDGSPADFTRMFVVRYAVMQGFTLIPLLGGIVGLADALAIFRKSRYCLHDDLADTVVVVV